MPGWGDHRWGPDPWGGSTILTPVLTGALLYWDDEEISERLGPDLCERGARFPFANTPPGHALCSLVPEFMCIEDLNQEFGGTGDWHRLLAILHDFLFGAPRLTGFVDDIASWICIFDVDRASDKFLNALLLHLGFTIKIPLTTSEKRKVIELLVDLYKRKGTDVGIVDALRILLGIQVEILPLTGTRFNGLECGEDISRTLSDITAATNFVQVDNPQRFEIGKNLVVTDVTAPFFAFADTPILNIQADRIFFAVQALGGTIELGAQVFCDRFCDQIERDGFVGGCSELGPDVNDAQDPALYTFYVDIQRTVTTTTDLLDGGSQVELSDVEFVAVGTRLRITDQTAPLQPVIIPEILTVDQDTKIVTFEPVSLSETIESGALAINLFNSEEIALINEVIEFAKVAHTHHVLTRDRGDAAAEVG